jgi:pimeloyl-ACP methyl ester carboxylesterase
LRKTIEYKGVEVVYSHIGVGQPVVLLHGFLEERGMWSDYAQKLSSAFEVISIDLLGQGESGNVGYAHSMEEHAAAVATVLFTENVDKCTVIGHSMGGYVALALAEKQPDLIAGLALFHSSTYPDSEDKKKDRERVIGLVQRNKGVYVNAAIPSLFAEHSRKNLNDEIQALIDIANDFSDQGIIANIRGMKDRKDRTKILKNGKFRKLIIHGELDSVISTDDVKKIAALSDDIRLEIVPNIGHMGHLEAPEECFELIADFCRN